MLDLNPDPHKIHADPQSGLKLKYDRNETKGQTFRYRFGNKPKRFGIVPIFSC
jgi:hypothetical protein